VSPAHAAPLAVSAVLGGCAYLLLWLDRYRAEPLPWMAAVAVWGVALPASLLAGGATVAALLKAPAAGRAVPELWVTSPLLTVALLGAGIGLPLLVVARSSVLEGPANGSAFGTVAGLAVSAGMEVFLAVSTPWRPSGAALVFVCLLHAAVGAAFGAGVGLTRLALPPAMRLPGVLASALASGGLGTLLVLGAVSSWRSWGDEGLGCNLALAGVAAAVVLAVFAASFSYETRVLAGQLGEEVDLGVLPAWVAEIVPSYARRVRSAWWVRRDERREILRLLVDMAFRKHRLRSLPAERARLYGLEVGRLRHRARVLLADRAEAAS